MAGVALVGVDATVRTVRATAGFLTRKSDNLVRDKRAHFEEYAREPAGRRCFLCRGLRETMTWHLRWTLRS